MKQVFMGLELKVDLEVKVKRFFLFCFLFCLFLKTPCVFCNYCFFSLSPPFSKGLVCLALGPNRYMA